LSSQTAQHTRPRRRRRRGTGKGGGAAQQQLPRPHHPPAERPSAPHDVTPIEFSALPIHATLRHALEERGFERTTPIQSAVLPFALAGEDVIGCAQTGTGKTAAFVLPILHRLLAADEREHVKGPRGYTRVLILAPTRELAVQIDDEIQGFAYHTGLSSAPIYGGVHMSPQDQALRAGVDIVVATPGRLLDHMRGDGPKFDRIETFVLDEADRMMDMGFWPDVRRIAQALPKSGLQTMLFSATMPDEIMTFAHELAAHAHYVQIGSTGAPAKTISHRAHIVPAHDKLEYLIRFLKKEAHGPVLVFARTMWSFADDTDPGTTLMTIPRAGGEPEELLTLAPPSPMIVGGSMAWLEDGSILVPIWKADLSDGQNGIWRVTPTGGIRRVVDGTENGDVPAPTIAAVSGDGTGASVTSLLNQSQRGARDNVFFLIDLEGGEVMAWEDLLGVDAAAGDGFIYAPPAFSPDDLSVAFVTVTRDGELTVAIADDVGTSQPIYTYPDEPGPSFPPGDVEMHIDWATNDTMLVLTHKGAVLLTVERSGDATPVAG